MEYALNANWMGNRFIKLLNKITRVKVAIEEGKREKINFYIKKDRPCSQSGSCMNQTNVEQEIKRE